MSPAVGNFVQDLVEMAKATETLPIVQHENETLKADLSHAQDTIAARETAIISYKQQIEDLHAKVRSLEVERDDASFRVLEAEDTAHSILTQARNAQATLAEVISKLDPPKPEPVKEPEPVLPQAVPIQSYEEAHPPAFEPIPHGTGAGAWSGQGSPTPPDAPQGQSEAPPTLAPTTPSGLGETPSPVSPSPSEPTPYSSELSDPEPSPRWSYEWYLWNDRRNERNKRQNEQANKVASGY